MNARKQSARSRLTIITIDQAIAGASNVLIAVLAARLLNVGSFGLFGIVFLVYVMLQGISRALVCDPLLVHPTEGQKRKGEVIGTTCMLGIALAVVVVLVGVCARRVDPELGDALIVLGVCAPLLVLQDLGRYLAFAMLRPARAVVLDTTWLVLLGCAVAGLVATNTRTLTWFITAWAGTGALAGLLLFSQHQVRELRLGFAWLRYTWGFSWRYLVSYVSTQGAALGGSSGVGAIAGAQALGGVQGAVLLTRPFATFQVAAIAGTVGEVMRSPGQRLEVRRYVIRTTALTTGIAVTNAVVMLVLPTGLGEAVLGASWHAARPLLLPTGVQLVAIGLFTGARAGLLGLRAIRQAMVIDVLSTVMVVVAMVVGAVVGRARGALWAVALAQSIMTVVWWTTFRLATRDDALDSAAAIDPADGGGDGATGPPSIPVISVSRTPLS